MHTMKRMKKIATIPALALLAGCLTASQPERTDWNIECTDRAAQVADKPKFGVGRFVLGLGDDALGELGEGEGFGLGGFAHGSVGSGFRSRKAAGQNEPRGPAARERARSLAQTPRKGNRKIARRRKRARNFVARAGAGVVG